MDNYFEHNSIVLEQWREQLSELDHKAMAVISCNEDGQASILCDPDVPIDDIVAFLRAAADRLENFGDTKMN